MSPPTASAPPLAFNTFWEILLWRNWSNLVYPLFPKFPRPQCIFPSNKWTSLRIHLGNPVVEPLFLDHLGALEHRLPSLIPDVKTPSHLSELSWRSSPTGAPLLSVLFAAQHGKKKAMLQKKTQKCKTSILLTSPVKWLRLSSVAQSCPTPWDPMNHSTPGLPVHHQLIAGSFFFSFFLSFICLTSCQTLFWGLPWWLSGKESTCECRRHGFDPWSRMIPHVAEQLSLHAATPEPML